MYYASGTCPSYHNQDTCVFSDKYLKCDAEEWCLNNGYTNTSCLSPKILDNQCPNGLSLYKICSCPSDYKYSCSGSGYMSGSGSVCNNKYTSCNCDTDYTWNGSACIQTHIHSYTCPSGYNSSCSYGYWNTEAKTCSCGATSGTCYNCKSYSEAYPSSNNKDYDCPEWACEVVNGYYDSYEKACNKSCADLVCGECACEAAGGTLVDGYCTDWCGTCLDITIEDSYGFPF